MGETVRLQKYIAMCGKASRRKAEELIAEGRVSVNGTEVRELGTKVELGNETVTLDGEIIKPEARKYYIMLNKPAGYVTTVKDQFDRPTVIDLVQSEINARVFPVGRLDYETEGLLLLTNDGDFAYRLTHPKFHVDKSYIATLNGGITESGLNRLRSGVRLEEFTTSPADVEILETAHGRMKIKITIHEGKNRQVRRMFEAVGSHVAELKRVGFANMELGNLPEGRWRHLNDNEISYLKKL